MLTYNAMMPGEDFDTKYVKIDKYKEMAKSGLVDERFVMPGVDINEYVPSPDKSSANGMFQFGQNSLETGQSPENKNGFEHSDIHLGLGGKQHSGLLNLKPVPGESMAEKKAKLGFMSPSGRIVRIQYHVEETIHANSQSPRVMSSSIPHKLPNEILKKYSTHYLTMTDPNPPHHDAHLNTLGSADIDEDIRTPPAIRSQQYKADYSSMLATAIKSASKHVN